MFPQTTLEEAQTALARLTGQETAPTAEKARRAFFIVSSVQRILRAFDFDQTKRQVVVTTDGDGKADLTGLMLGQVPAVASMFTNNTPMTYVLPSTKYTYHQGDYRYNIIAEDQGGGTMGWSLYTSEPNATINLEYFESPETISDTVKIALQPMVIAKGALIYFRQAEDPEADTSLEEDQFRQETTEIMEAQNRRRPQQFIQTQRDRSGRGIGYTSGGRNRFRG